MRALILSLCVMQVATAPSWAGKEKAAAYHELEVKVDGMSCPLCAYGLEKRLMKVEGCRETTIRVDDGLALLRLDPKAPIDLAAVNKAVKKGGFTPRGATLTAAGTAILREKRWFFKVSDSGTEFLLAENDKLTQLEKAGLEGKEIVATGAAEIRTDENDKPIQTLLLREFRPRKEAS